MLFRLNCFEETLALPASNKGIMDLKILTGYAIILITVIMLTLFFKKMCFCSFEVDAYVYALHSWLMDNKLESTAHDECHRLVIELYTAYKKLPSNARFIKKYKHLEPLEILVGGPYYVDVSNDVLLRIIADQEVGEKEITGQRKRSVKLNPTSRHLR